MTRVPIRDLYVGRLGLPTVESPLGELLGSEVTTTGDSTAVGQRRVKGFTMNFPIHGDMSGDVDPYANGQRMRRQLRSLIQNDVYRLAGVYCSFAFDNERNGWMVIGTCVLVDAEGGSTLAEYQLTIDNAYRVAGINTHRDGFRVEIVDRRLATTPVDFESDYVNAATSFAGITPLSLPALPVGASDPAVLDASCNVITRQGRDGPISLVVSKAPAWYGLSTTPIGNGDVISWERAEADFNKGDVVIYDRRGNLGPPPTT